MILALNELHEDVTLLNPTATAMAKDLFPLGTGNSYIDIECSPLFWQNVLRFVSSDVLQTASNNAIIFLPWIKELSGEELDHLLTQGSNSRIMFSGISIETAESSANPKCSTKIVNEQVLNYPSLRLLLIGGRIPQHLKADSRVASYVEYIHGSHKTSSTRHDSISFFGELTARRGLAEVLLVALMNPRLLIQIKGFNFDPKKTWQLSPSCTRFNHFMHRIASYLEAIVSVLLSQLRRLPNVHFSDQPFESEQELSGAISAATAVFYVFKTAYGSGIVTTALNSHVPIIWCGTHGYALDRLPACFPEGRIRYSDILRPGRIHRLVREIKTLESRPLSTWENFKSGFHQLTELSRSSRF